MNMHVPPGHEECPCGDVAQQVATLFLERKLTFNQAYCVLARLIAVSVSTADDPDVSFSLVMGQAYVHLLDLQRSNRNV